MLKNIDKKFVKIFIASCNFIKEKTREIFNIPALKIN